MTAADRAGPARSEPDFELDAYVAAFESAHARGGADPAAFAPPHGHPRRATVVCELVRTDLEFAWDAGTERRLEEYRDRFPELFADPALLRAVAWEEYRLRRAAGERPTRAEYRARFGIDLDVPDGPPTTCVTPTPGVTSVLRMPEPGECAAGYELLSELGRGAFGRVFLARETGLARRLVALKVSTKLPGESQTLARLQHSNVVPVYSVHRHGAYHFICMPYLGGTTLADLLGAFRGPSGLPGTGRGLVSTLAERTTRAAGPAPAPKAHGPAPALLEQLAAADYPSAVLLIAEQLADALAHAHERGVLHRDIKPANVLLADDGRPMLLDFNLAADAALGTDEQARQGGTPRYMAPEALRALADNRPLDDPRSDVYALGLVLYELLTAAFPFPDPTTGSLTEMAREQAARRDTGAPDVRAARPGVPAGPAAIVWKCLRPDPNERYRCAADLREDLRREREHRPLKFAPNTSVVERARKWAKRHPRLSSWVTLGTAAAALVALAVAWGVARGREAERLGAGAALTDLRAERDRTLLELLAPDAPSARAAAARERTAAALAPFGALDGGEWATGRAVAALPEGEREAARLDVARVLTEYAAACRALARTEPTGPKRAKLLADAERALARVPAAPGPGTDTADRARVALAAGRYRDVLNLVRAEPGTERNPAAWLARGLAHLRLNEPFDAVRCLDVAVALAPGREALLFHRGVALHATKRYAEAAADFAAVLERAPDDQDARFNRALALLEAGDARGALAELDRVERAGPRFTRVYFVRAQARRATGDTAGADADAQRGLELEPTDAISWVARGRARLSQVPPDAPGAHADFEAAVAADPLLVSAWENLAEVRAGYLNRPVEALAALDRVLELVPNATGQRAGRAVVRARLGRTDAARADAELCLRSDCDALTLYQLGCVYALTGRAPANRARALELLRAALRKDANWAKHMPTDPDLKNLANDADFLKLMSAVHVLTGDR